MVATAAFEAHVEQWQTSAQNVLNLARAGGGPAPDGVDIDAQSEESDDPANLAVDDLLGRSDDVLSDLEPALEEDQAAATQVAALVSANLVTANALITGSDDAVADVAMGDFSTSLQELAEQLKSPSPEDFAGPAADAEIPTNVTTELEEIEDAAGTETWNLLMNAAVQYAPSALDKGLGALLQGKAAEHFKAVRDALGKWRDWLKRAATKIVEWATGTLMKLLPSQLQAKLKEAFDDLKKKLEQGAGDLIGSGMGAVLGRTNAQARWSQAIDSGRDVTEALKKVTKAADGGVGRIKWVTKGREAIDKFGISVVIAAVSTVPSAQVAYFCAVAAVFLFVAWQLWDGIRDIGGLAPV